MTNNSIVKSAVLMVVIVLGCVAAYEALLRSQGVPVSFDDSSALWANSRESAIENQENTVVFVGSSRIKYDLDIPTWKARTGLGAVQLAHVGSNPVPMLEDLANDAEFKGNLVVDVTEPLFFSSLPFMLEKPESGIKYYHDRTLAQRASFELNYYMESGFVFLDKDNLSMNARLDRLRLPNREGVFSFPIFPAEFALTRFDRQTGMTERFVGDTSQVNVVRNIWAGMLKGNMGPPMTEAQIAAVIRKVRKSTDKIRSRGGRVIFVRTPSSGPFLQGETMGFPREKYWDKLLEGTQCPGIHFSDHAALSGFMCPEFSHLTPSDARKFTAGLVDILQQMQFIPVQKRLLTNI